MRDDQPIAEPEPGPVDSPPADSAGARRLWPLPRFQPPRPRGVINDPAPEPEPGDQDDAPAPAPARSPTAPSSDQDDTPIRTSTRGSSATAPAPAVGDVVDVVVQLVGSVADMAAGAVRWRRQRQLRRPTEQQVDDIGRPLGRLVYRHLRKYWGWLGPDILDGIAATAAAGRYMSDGPLTVPDTAAAGIPADLQEETYA